MVPGLLKGKTAAREAAPVLRVGDVTIDATLLLMPDDPAGMVRF